MFRLVQCFNRLFCLPILFWPLQDHLYWNAAKLSHLINFSANFPIFPRTTLFKPDILFACSRRSISGPIWPQVSYKGDRSVVESDPRPRNTFSCPPNSFETRNPSNFFPAFLQPSDLSTNNKYFLSFVLREILLVGQPQRNYLGRPQSCRLHNSVWLVLTENWARQQ